MRRRPRTSEDAPPERLARYVAAEWVCPEDWYRAWRVWTENWHDEHPDQPPESTLTWWLEAARTAPDLPFDERAI